MAVKLLVVDDSAFMRKIISDLIGGISGIEVAGIARNGLDALEVIPRIKPDIITLDIEMPKLNGLETLKIIKEKYDIPVIMLSSLSGRDITIEALELGALDFIEKPTDLSSNLDDFKEELAMKIRSISPKTVGKTSIKRRNAQASGRSINKEIGAVVIGASTGGPKALTEVLKKIPGNIGVPIFIVQHMPKGFTTSFAQRLDKESELKVVEAENNMAIERGVVYLAPGDYHMEVDGSRIKLNSNDKIYGVRPAVDYLFDSAARTYKSNLLGVIMTGMGRDGAEGMQSIKDMGGCNIAQNEETSVVYGMPGNAVAKGVIDCILSLDEIGDKLREILS